MTITEVLVEGKKIWIQKSDILSYTNSTKPIVSASPQGSAIASQSN